jgi:hypothetical protein
LLHDIEWQKSIAIVMYARRIRCQCCVLLSLPVGWPKGTACALSSCISMNHAMGAFVPLPVPLPVHGGNISDT